jgi:hypothetical protein
VTPPRQSGPSRGPGPDIPVTDAVLIDVLQGLQAWRSVGDSVDWELALFAYDVPPGVHVAGVPVPPPACPRGR